MDWPHSSVLASKVGRSFGECRGVSGETDRRLFEGTSSSLNSHLVSSTRTMEKAVNPATLARRERSIFDGPNELGMSPESG